MKKLSLAMVVLMMLPFLNASFSIAEDERPVVTALLQTSQLPAAENSVLQEICERTQIDFQPLVVEGSALEERYNTLAAAGMLPDIILRGGKTEALELVENGVVLALDDLLAEYGPDIVQNRGMFFEQSAAYIDGKLYGIPLNAFSTGNALMVRQDWLDAVGKEVPTTIDEFYDVLVAFTKNDPDGNGKDDTIGLGVTMNFATTIEFLLGRYTEDPLPVMTYTWIEGPTGSAGSAMVIDSSFLAITANAKHPDAAMRLLNFLCSEEGNQLAYAGIEGKHWEWNPEGGITYLGEYTDSSKQRDDGVYCYWPTLRYNGMQDQLLTETTQYGYQIANEHNCAYADLPYSPEAADYISFNPEEMFSALLLTQGDMQEEYDRYIQDYLENGGEQWIQEATEIYTAQ